MSLRYRGTVLFVLGLLAACAYTGTSMTDNPVARNLSWYSYLNGDDIRSTCAAGAPDQYRFVYNGIYVEQVRSYDLTENGAEDGHRLATRVFGPTEVGRILLGSPKDVFEPWRGETAVTVLRDADLEKLRESMETAGIFAPPPVGLRLASEDFYWTVAACRNGRFAFTAYKCPSERFRKTALMSALLFGWDFTGVPVNEPREANLMDIYGTRSRKDLDQEPRFTIEVGENGLKGLPPRL